MIPDYWRFDAQARFALDQEHRDQRQRAEPDQQDLFRQRLHQPLRDDRAGADGVRDGGVQVLTVRPPLRGRSAARMSGRTGERAAFLRLLAEGGEAEAQALYGQIAARRQRRRAGRGGRVRLVQPRGGAGASDGAQHGRALLRSRLGRRASTRRARPNAIAIAAERGPRLGDVQLRDPARARAGRRRGQGGGARLVPEGGEAGQRQGDELRRQLPRGRLGRAARHGQGGASSMRARPRAAISAAASTMRGCWATRGGPRRRWRGSSAPARPRRRRSSTKAAAFLDASPVPAFRARGRAAIERGAARC